MEFEAIDVDCLGHLDAAVALFGPPHNACPNPHIGKLDPNLLAFHDGRRAATTAHPAIGDVHDAKLALGAILQKIARLHFLKP